MQQAEEAAAEAEAQRLRHFRLILQRGVVEFEFFPAIRAAVVLIRLNRIKPANTCGLISLKPGKGSVALASALVIVSPTLAAFSSLMPEMTKPTRRRQQFAALPPTSGENTPTCSNGALRSP